MEPVVSAIRMNPFAMKILQLAVKDVLERFGCREYAIDPETGNVDAQVMVNGYESHFLFLLNNPFLEVAVTQPHPALSREEACRAVDNLADRVLQFVENTTRARPRRQAKVGQTEGKRKKKGGLRAFLSGRTHPREHRELSVKIEPMANAREESRWEKRG